jgi:hypothetical protein
VSSTICVILLALAAASIVLPLVLARLKPARVEPEEKVA